MADIIFYTLAGCAVFFTLVVFVNLVSAPVFSRKQGSPAWTPKVSILIPARNEAATIGRCLESLAAQTYARCTIIVLDDESTDGTSEEVLSYARRYENISLIKGTQLPDGWTGKNWACHQLARAAGSDLLLFMDADCRIAEWGIEGAVACMERYKLDLLSSFPTQEVRSLGEKLVVPCMNWLLLTFLPLRLVYLSPWLSFVAANGQFMLFQRYAYNAIGGHVAVADRLVEDMELARAVKLKGLRVMTVLGGEGIFCRMYDSFRGALAGFTKNFYPGFNVNPAAFVLMLLFFFSVFLAPVIMTIWDARYAACIVLLASQRIMLSVLGRQNAAWNVLLHPFQMCVMLMTGIVSIWKTKRKTVIWKGRWVSQK